MYIVYPSSLYLFMYHVYVFVFVYVLPLFVTNTNSASLKMKVEKLIKKNAVQIIPFIQLLRQSSLAYIYIYQIKNSIYILYSIYTRIYIYIHMLENFMYKTKIKNNKLNKNVCKKNWNLSRNCEKSKNNKKNKFYWAKPIEFSYGSGKSPKIEDKWFPAQ